MKNVVISLSFTVLVMSCNNEKIFFSERTIKEYSKGNFKLPSIYGHLYMFIKVEKGKLASTNINQLHTMYISDYSKSYNTFDSFLFDALNQRLVFTKNYIIKRNGIVFELNNMVSRNYEELGIEKFLNHYCERDKENWSIKKENVNPNTLFTILYFFFINQYEVSNDDYIGKYYISKTESNLDH